MNSVFCDLCPRKCKIKSGEYGFCKARKNENDKIIPANYGEILSIALDPVEKKPFMDFCQGNYILSVGSYGCNMVCQFCQNYSISRAEKDDLESKYISPREPVNIALNLKKDKNIGIAFTYNEPLVGYEYVLDTSKIAKEERLETAVITNGNFETKYIEELIPNISAFNVDLKAFDEQTYRKLGGEFNTVLKNIEKIAQKTHLEITSLIVPQISDNIENFEKTVQRIAKINSNIPLHISRYFPAYKYDLPPTERELIYKFYSKAKEYLSKVQIGNM